MHGCIDFLYGYKAVNGNFDSTKVFEKSSEVLSKSYFSSLISSHSGDESKEVIPQPRKIEEKHESVLATGILTAGVAAESFLAAKLILQGNPSVSNDDLLAMAGFAGAGFIVGSSAQMFRNSAMGKERNKKLEILNNFNSFATHVSFRCQYAHIFHSQNKSWKE